MALCTLALVPEERNCMTGDCCLTGLFALHCILFHRIFILSMPLYSSVTASLTLDISHSLERRSGSLPPYIGLLCYAPAKQDTHHWRLPVNIQLSRTLIHAAT